MLACISFEIFPKYHVHVASTECLAEMYADWPHRPPAVAAYCYWCWTHLMPTAACHVPIFFRWQFAPDSVRGKWKQLKFWLETGAQWTHTWTAFSTSSTTSVTFSRLNDAQCVSVSLNSTSSHNFINLPSDRYTCVVADMIALLFSFSVYDCSAVCTFAIDSSTIVPLPGNISNLFLAITSLKCCRAFFTCRTW